MQSHGHLELSKQETPTIFLTSFRTFNAKGSMAENFKVDDFCRGRHEEFGVRGGFLMGTVPCKRYHKTRSCGEVMTRIIPGRMCPN